VSRQSERIYAERALHAGAAGYWMKNGSAEELMRAVDTVAAGELYASLTITERKKLLETQPLADLHFRLGSEQTKPRFAGPRSGSKSALSLDYVLSRVGKVYCE
jgi:DNA-binding NarL/FixJ family response regulator